LHQEASLALSIKSESKMSELQQLYEN